VANRLSANCIETERLRLRKARSGDADGIAEIQTDDRVRRYLGGRALCRTYVRWLSQSGLRSCSLRAATLSRTRKRTICLA
jgi:hypothetical protein